MEKIQIKKKYTRPILRWVGGKQLLIDQLLAYCPANAFEKRYFEPFLGAASLFLALHPKNAYLSDANPHLINAYRKICNETCTIARLLSDYSKRDSYSFYYSIRDLYNHTNYSTAQAARFLYLNRTCFNGIFRVNKDNKFNVPYGYKKKPWFPNREELIDFANAIKNAKIFNEDYKVALRRAKGGDFIYLDPPYPPLNGTSNFAHYTMDRFGIEQQYDLANEVLELDRKGCMIMISNADTKLIRELYEKYDLHSLEVTRYVTCKSTRHQVKELVITNY